MPQFHFMAGLPRSGSTLISSVLNQNPAIHSGPNSPMCGMMFNLERSILVSEQWAAHPKSNVMPATIAGVLVDWYSDVEADHVIDKSREWAIPEHWQVLQRVMPEPSKCIMPVRNITDILASFIALVHRNEGVSSFIDREVEARQEFNFYRPVDDIRCDHLMRPKGLIDNSLYGIAYALMPEVRDQFHFVEYDALIDDPTREITAIYDFLGIEHFDHDYDAIVNEFPEDDEVYGLPGMHDVRPSVSRRIIDKEAVLSPYVLGRYTGLESWR